MDRKPFFQMLNNRHSAWIASEMILQQLEDVIEENKESYQTLLETLKEDYTLRAEIVANLLEMEERLYQTTEEYRKNSRQWHTSSFSLLQYSAPYPDTWKAFYLPAWA